MGRPFFYCVIYNERAKFQKAVKNYYSPRGHWKGFAAIKKLAQAANVSEDVAQNWLVKQALWQIYLPAPRYIPRPKFDVPVPNKVHQADLLYLPHDRPPRSRKTFKYALTVVDVAFRFKEAEPLTTKEGREVAAALERIYSRSPLSWPILLQVDPGREFMGAVNQLLSKHNVEVNAVVWIFTVIKLLLKDAIAPWLKDCLDTNMGLKCPSQTTKDRLNGWHDCPLLFQLLIKKSLDWPVTKPAEAIKKKTVSANPSTPCLRPVGVNEKKLPSGSRVRYLYQPGELEGGRRRAIDPIWSLKVYEIEKIMIKPDAPVFIYLFDGPKRGFVR